MQLQRAKTKVVGAQGTRTLDPLIKNYMFSTHPILGDELRALRRLQREQDLSRHSYLRPSGVRRSVRLGSPA